MGPTSAIRATVSFLRATIPIGRLMRKVAMVSALGTVVGLLRATIPIQRLILKMCTLWVTALWLAKHARRATALRATIVASHLQRKAMQAMHLLL